MTTTHPPASPDDFEPTAEANEPQSESTRAERPAGAGKNAAPVIVIDARAVTAVLAVAAVFLLRDPNVRKVCGNVLQDPELNRVCREAGAMMRRELVATWDRHGGTAAVANALFRHATAR